jgi:hypothetical protein
LLKGRARYVEEEAKRERFLGTRPKPARPILKGLVGKTRKP